MPAAEISRSAWTVAHEGGDWSPRRAASCSARTPRGEKQENTLTGVPAMKKVFTTGQVAKICKVAPRTVSKWFDSGRLRGYRIPGSQDRRIPREHLIQFLKEHGMPLGELEEEGWHKILIIGAEKLFIDRVKELLPEDDDFKYELANSGFEAGIQAESFHPDTIIIDLAMGRSEALQIASNLRRNPALRADPDHRPGQRGRSRPRSPGQLRLQRSLQEAVRRRPAGRAHPHAGRREARRTCKRLTQLPTPRRRPGSRRRGPGRFFVDLSLRERGAWGERVTICGVRLEGSRRRPVARWAPPQSSRRARGLRYTPPAAAS